MYIPNERVKIFDECELSLKGNICYCKYDDNVSKYLYAWKFLHSIIHEKNLVHKIMQSELSDVKKVHKRTVYIDQKLIHCLDCRLCVFK